MRGQPIRTAFGAVTLAASLAALSGCVPVVIGAGVVAGAAVATDRRTTGTQLDDEVIEDRAVLEIRQRFKAADFHVNVTSYGGIVLLTGEVPAEAGKTDVENILRSNPKVRAIQDELLVGPVTDLGSRSNDTLVTSKVKARFVEANKFQINHVKVVTERGVVYLMGIVTRDEGAAAGELASTTAGAQRVVKVFEYISG
jgi:osmotically-inducible protein OsmY